MTAGLSTIARISLDMSMAALFLAFFRVARGPTLPDRLVALDLTAIIGAGIIAIEAVVTGQEELVDVAIVLALVVFLGTIVFARYLERASRA